MNSLEKIWARATGHLMGNTDDDSPDVPILTLGEAKIALFLKTFWVVLHVITCCFIIANTIHSTIYYYNCVKCVNHQIL